MLSYTHFTLEERECLHQLLVEGKSIRKIADILGRSPSSVSREIKRNRSKHTTAKNCDNKYLYHPWRAQVSTIMRKRRGKKYRLQPGSKEWDYVISGLEKFWSPDEISKRFRKNFPEEKIFGVSTIYRDLKRKRFPKVSVNDNLRRRGKRRYSRRSKFNTIKPDRLIPQHPDEIRDRTRWGDFEGDTVVGKGCKGAIVTMVDRKTRFLVARVVKSRDSQSVKDAIIQMLSELHIKSISLDNGAEFAEFHAIEDALKVPIYFAEPHKPWQRGTNENTNGLLRFFYPKGYDLLSLNQEDLDVVVDLINNRPRKTLDYLSPSELLDSLGVALT